MLHYEERKQENRDREVRASSALRTQGAAEQRRFDSEMSLFWMMRAREKALSLQVLSQLHCPSSRQRVSLKVACSWLQVMALPQDHRS